jgi:hypothetical protein
MSKEDDFDLEEESEEFEDPEFDPWYSKMLDAVGEYLDSIGSREDREINERDILIIRALIDFYGFEAEDFLEVLEDVNVRTKQVELEKENKNVTH